MWKRQDRISQRQQKQQPARSAANPGSGIFRFPKRHAYLILLIVVMVVSYYQPTLSAFFAPARVASAHSPLQQKIASADREGAEFMTTMMATLDETWQDQFQKQGLHYQPPKFILYRGAVHSSCEPTHPAVGTFYCPKNHTLYLSLDLYDALKNRPPAESESLLGYILAHMVGHHVQMLLRSSKATQAAALPLTRNRLKDELQADCFAGLWGHLVAGQQILVAGDWQSALKVNTLFVALREQYPEGVLIPDDLSYATAAVRYQYFNRGLAGGGLTQCLMKEESPGRS